MYRHSIVSTFFFNSSMSWIISVATTVMWWKPKRRPRTRERARSKNLILNTEKHPKWNLLFLLEGTCGKCLSRWILHNSSCYFFSNIESTDVRKNWPDSRADCVSRGADLVVIDNQEEQVGWPDWLKNDTSTEPCTSRGCRWGWNEYLRIWILQSDPLKLSSPLFAPAEICERKHRK